MMVWCDSQDIRVIFWQKGLVMTRWNGFNLWQKGQYAQLKGTLSPIHIISTFHHTTTTSTMMSALLRTGSRAIARTTSRTTSFSSARFFSAEPSASVEDKPLIPGIGRGKTSTGLVRLFCVLLCLWLFMAVYHSMFPHAGNWLKYFYVC